MSILISLIVTGLCIFAEKYTSNEEVKRFTDVRVEPISCEFIGDTGADTVDNMSQIEVPSEQLPQLLETLEPQSIKRTGKCNLRKSLAWNSAFFENPGLL